MYLTVFIVFLALSFVLIALGLFRSEHTELSLVGFVFLFLLSFMVINQNLEYNTGFNETYTYGLNLTSITLGDTNTTNSIPYLDHTYRTEVYTPISLEGGLAHLIGYWLAVISIIGFIGVILGLKGSRRFI